MNWYNIIGWVGLIAVATSCDSLFLEPTIPSDQIPADKAIATQEDAQNLLNAAYNETANYLGGQYQTLSELLGDNLRVNSSSGNLVQVYNRASDFFNGDVGGNYGTAYRAIYRANDLIERLPGLVTSGAITESIKTQMEAEAHFLRALGHFELVRLWAQPSGATTGDSHDGIVLATGTSYELTARSSVADVYASVIGDLTFAVQNLPAENGFYATNWAAKALLARVHFQAHNYGDASTIAADVIDNGPFTFNTTDPNERLTLTGNSYEPTAYENVFTLVSTSNIDNRSGYLRGKYNTDAASPPFLRITNSLGASILADNTDPRTAWLVLENEGAPNEYYGLNKFNPDFLNVGILSLTEMYLIAAESYAEENSAGQAVSYLNPVLIRAGQSTLSNTEAIATIKLTTQATRRIEFLGEGHRTHDLKRLGSGGENVTVRGADWNCNGMILQFPASEQSDKFTMNPEGGC